MEKRIIKTSKAPAPIGPYNQAVQAYGMLFISGQIPIIPATGELEEGGIKAETEQVMQNLKAILEEAELDFSHVVKTSIFISDMNDFVDVNEVYGKYFGEEAPA